MTFEFTIELEEEFNDELINKLSVSCNDGLVCRIAEITKIDFAREAENLDEAIESAVVDLSILDISIKEIHRELR